MTSYPRPVRSTRPQSRPCTPSPRSRARPASARFRRRVRASIAPDPGVGWLDGRMGEWLYLIIGIAVVAIVTAGLLTSRRRRRAAEPAAPTSTTDVISRPVDRGGETEAPVADDLLVEEPPAPTVEKPEATASRLVRLRQRWRVPRAASGGVCWRCCRGSGSTRTPGGHRGHPADRGRRCDADPGLVEGRAPDCVSTGRTPLTPRRRSGRPV